MALPALVLVHGGAHAGDCWELTVDEIHRLAPELTMAGVTVPGVVTKLGASRVREVIFAAACVPHEGAAMVDVVAPLTAMIARRNARKRTLPTVSARSARLFFLNGVSRARRRFMIGRRYPDSARIWLERVSRRGMPNDVPRTWLLTSRDRTVSVKQQRASIEAIGGVQTVIPIDTCHALMVSEPERLAEILVERCRQYR